MSRALRHVMAPEVLPRFWNGQRARPSHNKVVRTGRVALADGPASSAEWLVDTGKFVYPTAVTVGGGHLYWWDHERGTVSQATTDGEDVNSRWLKIPRSFDPSADLAYFDRYVFVAYSVTREGPSYIARQAEDGSGFTPRFRHTNFVSAFAVTVE